MFKRILRWRLRRKHIDPELVDAMGFSEARALRELFKPTLRNYVTPEMVEEALAARERSRESGADPD